MTEPIVDMEIEGALELIQDKKHRDILIQHQKEHGSSEITVTEKEDVFETIVTHPSTEDQTGGAEQYFVDKKTGESTMGWHEHPMARPESIENLNVSEGDRGDE